MGHEFSSEDKKEAQKRYSQAKDGLERAVRKGDKKDIADKREAFKRAGRLRARVNKKRNGPGPDASRQGPPGPLDQ